MERERRVEETRKRVVWKTRREKLEDAFGKLFLSTKRREVDKALARTLDFFSSSDRSKQKKKIEDAMPVAEDESSAASQPQQQLVRRLSSRRRSRALSLGRWAGGGDAGGNGTSTSGDVDGIESDVDADLRASMPVLNEYAASKAASVGSKVSEVGLVHFVVNEMRF